MKQVHHLEDLQKEVNMKKGHVQDQAYMKTQDIVIKQVHHLEDQAYMKSQDILRKHVHHLEDLQKEEMKKGQVQDQAYMKKNTPLIIEG